MSASDFMNTNPNMNVVNAANAGRQKIMNKKDNIIDSDDSDNSNDKVRAVV